MKINEFDVYIRFFIRLISLISLICLASQNKEGAALICAVIFIATYFTFDE